MSGTTFLFAFLTFYLYLLGAIMVFLELMSFKFERRVATGWAVLWPIIMPTAMCIHIYERVRKSG